MIVRTGPHIALIALFTLLAATNMVRGDDGLGDKLIAAAYEADVPAMQALISAGADVNYADSHEITPLYAAIVTADAEKVRLLIEHQANVNAKSPPFKMPLLSQACAVGAGEIVDLLLAAGADPKALDECGGGAMEEAAFYGDRKLVARLRKAGATTKNELEVASGIGDLKAIAKELDGGAKVNRQFKGWKSTPLMFAAAGRQPAAVRLLLERGADPKLANFSGSTALHFAAMGETPEIAELLIARGADVNATDEEGSTPLDQAGSEEVVAWLKAKGARSGEELAKE